MRQVQGPETGGAAPRSAHAGNTSARGVGGLVLLVISPVALLAAVACVLAHGAPGAPPLVGMGASRRPGAAVVVGAVMQWITGNVLAAHYGGLIPSHQRPGLVAGRLGRHAAPRRADRLAGRERLYVGLSRIMGGPSRVAPRWSNTAERWISTKARPRSPAWLPTPAAQARCSGIPLGVVRDGDLGSWTERGFVVPPPGQVPGHGPTRRGGIGQDRDGQAPGEHLGHARAQSVLCRLQRHRPRAGDRGHRRLQEPRGPRPCCALWPAQPLDMWRGTPTEIANRLLQVQDFTEPYYKAVAETAVRLAVLAPDIDGRGPVTDSASFMHRLDADFLKRAYEHTRRGQERDRADRATPRASAACGSAMPGFSRLLAALDHGFSFEDVDLAVLSVPTLAQQSDAMAVARMILLDFGAYCIARKPRLGEDVTFIVDEFSARDRRRAHGH